MSCCGGNCGCGSGCKCGSGCGGCKMYPEMDEGVTAGQTLVMGVAPSTKPSFEPSAGQTLVMGVAPSTKPSFEPSAGAENDGGCTCSPCTCDPCTCK